MGDRYPEFDMSTEEAFGSLLQILIKQTEAAKGTPGGKFDRMLDAEVLSFKVVQHAISTLALFRGAQVPELAPHSNYKDLFSVMGLARMCHESFLVFSHLFVTPVSDDEGEFRFLAWRYVDTAKQARFPTYTDEGREMSKGVKEQAATFLIELEKHPRFQSLGEKPRRRIVEERKWPLLSWGDLGIEAGFNDQHAVQIYRYLCSYAHPGHLSIKQLRLAAGTEMQQHLMETGFKHCAVILGCLAQDFPIVFKKAAGVIQENSMEHRLVHLYAGFARGQY